MSSIKDKGGSSPYLPSAAEAADQASRVAGQMGQAPRPAGRPAREERTAVHSETLGPRKLSASEAERLASANTVVRGARRRGPSGLDVDEGQGRLALPVEEVDEGAWDQAGLERAQDAMLFQASLLAECAAAGVLDGPADGMMGRLCAYLVTSQPELAARLQAKMDGEGDGGEAAPDAAELPSLASLRAVLEAYRGAPLGDMDVSQALVGAAGVVAGRPEALPEAGAQVAPAALLNTVQGVLAAGQASVQGARDMNSGIDKQLAVQRTFVFKR